MRFYEFNYLLENKDEYLGNLLSVLRYLQQNANNKDSNGQHQMSSVINQVKNAGSTTFNYKNFVTAFEKNDAVKNLVSNYNKEYVTLKLDSDENSQQSQPKSKEDRDKTLSKMAKKAVDL